MLSGRTFESWQIHGPGVSVDPTGFSTKNNIFKMLLAHYYLFTLLISNFYTGDYNNNK